MDYNQVWCYDLEDRRNKLFKTVRIETVEVMTNDWTCEVKHEMGFVDIFRYSSQERHRIKMELDVRARNVMLECFPMSEKFITQIDDNTWLLDTVVCGLQYVKNFVLMVEGAKLVES